MFPNNTNVLVYRRDYFSQLIAQNNYKIGVEVGVSEGNFSSFLLKTTHLNVLHSVDCWLKENGEFDEKTYLKCKKNLEEFENRSVIIVKTSLDASKMFNDGFFDFIYIDADHSYEAIKEDLAMVS